MSRKTGAWSIAKGLLELVFLLGLAAGLLYGLVRLLDSLESDLATAIVAAGFAGVVSIVSLGISKWYETRTGALKEIRERKTPVYEAIVGTMFRVMFAGMFGQEPLGEGELKAWFADTTEKLSIWGSNDLILAFGKFKNGFSESNPEQGLFAFEALLLAIRKDLGHGSNLERGASCGCS